MKILILNGSPHPNGNTAKMLTAFREGAEAGGHEISQADVARKNIRGCLGCEYCHKKGKGTCIQKDDMREIYPLLRKAELLILASPIYYHGLSGQLKCVIDRFYAICAPNELPKLRKIAMFLSSGDPDMYVGAQFSYKGDFIDYLGLEGLGVFTSFGDVSQEKLDELRAFGESLQ